MIEPAGAYALNVDCPRCLCPAGWGCSDLQGRWQPTFHSERRQLAAKADDRPTP